MHERAYSLSFMKHPSLDNDKLSFAICLPSIENSWWIKRIRCGFTHGTNSINYGGSKEKSLLIVSLVLMKFLYIYFPDDL